MKKTNSLVCLSLVSLFSIAATSCGNNQKSSEPSDPVIVIPEVSDPLKVLEGINFNYSKAIFDDFTDGVDYDTWLISEDCWGSNKGGITVKNLFYTDEGTLLLRANGNYYSGDEVQGYGSVKDGRCTGAALVSKFVTGPGRYQVKMKPFPRLGACTAFWTYSNRPVSGADNDNHEIDIELPGGMTSGHSFEKLMNTNYITEPLNDHADYIVSERTNNQVVFLNDGEFHTFGFDWYTNPEVIIYYIDDIVTCVSTTFIPYLLSRLWLGVWISTSDGFMGAPDFETDFMEVDWVNYIPFDDTQPFTPWDVDIVSKSAPRNKYPTSPSSKPVVNQVSNGDFEYFVRKNKQEDYGWIFDKVDDDELPVSELCYLDQHNGKDGTCGATIRRGGYLSTTIDAAYSGFKYDLSLDATDSVMRIAYYSSTIPAGRPISVEYVPINQLNWAKYQKSIVCPTGCRCMQFDFYNANENTQTSFSIDNVSLVRK